MYPDSACYNCAQLSECIIYSKPPFSWCTFSRGCTEDYVILAINPTIPIFTMSQPPETCTYQLLGTYDCTSWPPSELMSYVQNLINTHSILDSSTAWRESYQYLISWVSLSHIQPHCWNNDTDSLYAHIALYCIWVSSCHLAPLISKRLRFSMFGLWSEQIWDSPVVSKHMPQSFK